MEQHLSIKERIVTFIWVCFSLYLWFETLLPQEIMVWLIFSVWSLRFQLPVPLQGPVVAWTLKTLSLVIFQLDKGFTSVEHVSTEYHSLPRIN